MSSIERILQLFDEHGDSEYGGEAVTQREHAIQTALLAEEQNAPSPLIAAALLHDIGHLLHKLPDDAPEEGVDDVHEELGERFLKKMFPPAVCEPVRMHVLAKRYLCATDPDYFGRLSPPSVTSLQLPGGPMSDGEVADFESTPFFDDAVKLRRWDDEAKVVGKQTPEIAHFAPHLANALEGAS